MKHRGGWLRHILLIALVALVPALFVNPGAGESLTYNLAWTGHFAAHPFSRWMPDAFEGLGSPTFYFYPPLAFWISGAFAMVLPAIPALGVAGFLFMAASGLAMRIWLREIGAHPVGAVLYLIAPYHLYDFYVRGAFAEFAAYAWIPLVALGIHRRQPWLLALAYAGLILTHLPTALLASLFLVAPMAVRGSIRTVAIGCVLGAGLASFYLVPALTLQPYVSIDALWNGFYRPSAWALWESFDEPNYVPVILFTALGLCAAVILSRFFWSSLTIACGAMALAVVPFVWDLPVLEQVQFPWRLLSIVEFAATTAVCLKPPPKALAGLALAMLAVPYAAVAGLAVEGAKVPAAASEPPEYLPRGVDLSAVDDRQRNVDLSRFRELPRGDVLVIERPGRHSFGRFAFPIWRVERDGRLVPSVGPVISFEATEPGIYRLRRITIWQEIAGWLLSGTALLLLVLLSRFDRRRGPGPVGLPGN